MFLDTAPPIPQAIQDYELVMWHYKPFHLQLAFDDTLLSNAKATRDQCEVTKFEALVLKAWKGTQEKSPAERHTAIESRVKKFNTTGADPKLVQKGVWKAIQQVLSRGPPRAGMQALGA